MAMRIGLARITWVLGAALAGLIATAPAAAQNANDKVLVVYGTDPCPAGTICVRKGESERFRIPKEIRESTPAAGNERWADRAKSVQTVGNYGTGSCSATGAGGFTGCFQKQMAAAKAERAAAKASGGTE